MNKNNNMDKIREVKYRVNQNRRILRELEDSYKKAYEPQSYKEATSYNDEDTIRGSRKEWRIEAFFEESEKLKAMIELDLSILDNLKSLVDDDEYLKLLKNNMQKVKYLRIVKGYTQKKTAEILDISIRSVQRIDKKNR